MFSNHKLWRVRFTLMSQVIQNTLSSYIKVTKKLVVWDFYSMQQSKIAGSWMISRCQKFINGPFTVHLQCIVFHYLVWLYHYYYYYYYYCCYYYEVVVVMIAWYLDVQSMPITTKFISSNPAHGEVNLIQEFDSDLREVVGVLQVI